MGRGDKGKMIGTVDTTEADKATPKSIIIYRGEVSGHVRALMHEWRRVFLPWSSKRLHGQNKSLKDFLVIASTFSVSHLQLFTTPANGTSLRIMRFANGPTLSLRVESFQLREDILKTVRRPAPVDGPAFDVAPIVVLHNFKEAARMRPEVALLETALQGMFPSINIQLVKPTEIQRVVLFHYDIATGLIEQRHYMITAKAVGLSKTVKKLLEGRLPTKLGTLDEVDNLLEREGAWSDTDGEGEEVELTQPFRAMTGRCRVRLSEIGPRMTLKLVKIESGFAGGETLFHDHVAKTPREVAINMTKVRSKKLEKQRRKRVQDENVKRKRDAKTERLERKKTKRLEAMKAQRENPLEIAGGGMGGGGGGGGDDDDGY